MGVNISHLGTETRNSATQNIDLLSSKEIIEIMNNEDLKVVETIRQSLDKIAAVINECIKAYKNGGRIVYIGAGTSGRLGLMDAVEIVPTFNSDRFVGLIAGGSGAY